MLNAYSYTQGQQVRRGPAQDAVRAGQPRRGVASRTRACTRAWSSTNKDLTAGQRLAGGELPADHHRLRPRARGADRYTRGHSERVANYARLIAIGLQLPEPEIENVVQVGPDARRRQDRHPQRSAQQAGQAHARGAGDVPLPPGQGQAHPRADPVHARHHPRLLLPPRGLGRPRLPAGPDGRTTSRWSAASSPSPTPTTP